MFSNSVPIPSSRRSAGRRDLIVLSSVFMKKVNVEMVSPPSGKGWWPKVKNVVKKVGAAAAVVAASPLKLPKAIKGVAQYLALLAGLVDASKEQKDE